MRRMRPTLRRRARGIRTTMDSMRQKPGAQAYDDSIARLYASWDVDFIKVDCIASRPYLGDEIRMLSEALRKTGRPIVLSLSPGAAPLDKVDEMRKYAQMWRISDDVWDLWHSTVPYPQGLGDQFANVAKWAGLAAAGTLAGRGHVAARPTGTGARLGASARHEAFARRTTDTRYALVHLPFSVDDWRRIACRG